jgi:uncharacterized protein (TIGR00369 family)
MAEAGATEAAAAKTSDERELMADSPSKPNPLHELTARLAAGELAEIPPGTVVHPPGGLFDVFGIELTHVGPGSARAQMKVRQVHLNQRGVVQGGAIVALADAAAGWASYTTLPDPQFTTLDLSCNLTGPARDGALLVATATPVHLGRRTQVLDVTVQDVARATANPGRGLVARFSCTQLVLSAR